MVKTFPGVGHARILVRKRDIDGRGAGGVTAARQTDVPADVDRTSTVPRMREHRNLNVKLTETKRTSTDFHEPRELTAPRRTAVMIAVHCLTTFMIIT